MIFLSILLKQENQVIFLRTGTEEKVRECTAECVAEGVDAVAPGCGLVLQTPLNNLKAMVDTALRLKKGGRLG